jgi:hypothetical protein
MTSSKFFFFDEIDFFKNIKKEKLRMSSDYESDEESELPPFGKTKIEFEEGCSEHNEPIYEPIDWDEIDSVIERRCKSCEKFREEKNYGDFICKHIKGYAEAPANVRRCYDCDRWRKEKDIKGNFWCKHNKYRKEEWDSRRGWEGASERAQEIREWHHAVRNGR